MGDIMPFGSSFRLSSDFERSYERDRERERERLEGIVQCCNVVDGYWLLNINKIMILLLESAFAILP
jgi:hypothetical protein